MSSKNPRVSDIPDRTFGSKDSSIFFHSPKSLRLFVVQYSRILTILQSFQSCGLSDLCVCMSYPDQHVHCSGRNAQRVCETNLTRVMPFLTQNLVIFSASGASRVVLNMGYTGSWGRRTLPVSDAEIPDHSMRTASCHTPRAVPIHLVVPQSLDLLFKSSLHKKAGYALATPCPLEYATLVLRRRYSTTSTTSGGYDMIFYFHKSEPLVPMHRANPTRVGCSLVSKAGWPSATEAQRRSLSFCRRSYTRSTVEG